MSRFWTRSVLLAACALAASCMSAGSASAQVSATIQEIFIDPPNTATDDNDREYFEIYTPSALADATQSGQYEYYFIAIENEDDENDNSPSMGQIDFVQHLVEGSSGYYWYASSSGGGELYSVAEATLNPNGDTYSGDLENSGATYMIVAVLHQNTQPAVGQDWDLIAGGVGGTVDDGILSGATYAAVNPVILDSVGVFCEAGDVTGANDYGALYSSNYNFVPSTPSANIKLVAGTTINTNTSGGSPAHAPFTEIEYVGRNVDGTWYAANLSSNDHASYNGNDTGVATGTSDPEAMDVNGDTPYSYPQIITDTRGAANH